MIPLRRRRGRRELLADLVRNGHSLATSALNIAEVYAGMRAEEESGSRQLLEALECFDITGSSGELAGRLKHDWARKGRTLTLADTIIAAVCLQNDCALLTDNRKNFPMPELRIHPLAAE